MRLDAVRSSYDSPRKALIRRSGPTGSWRTTYSKPSVCFPSLLSSLRSLFPLLSSLCRTCLRLLSLSLSLHARVRTRGRKGERMGVLQKQPQAEVHLYERGQGPKHQFMVNLKGWEPNRIDVAGIMKAYNMKGLYAFSVVSGRGMELVPDKKNGLSRTTYSGKEGMIIRLDGEPQPSSYVKWNSTVMTLGATVFAFALLAGFVSMDSGRVDHMRRLKQEGPGWPLLLVGSLIVAIYVWRVWRASLMRWYK